MSFKHPKTLLLVIAALSLPIILQVATAITAAPGFTPPFHASSIWNRPISSAPALNPNSAQMINLLASTVGNHINIDGIDGAWSVPVYYASPGTPLKQVCDAARYRPCEIVPFPAGLAPSPDSDAKTVIIDLGSNPPRAWSFWMLQRGDGSNGDWTAGWGAFGWGNISTSGDGIRNYGGGEWGGRVSGWNYYAGLIHPEEIMQGRIDHALAFFIPQQVAAGTFVWPAAGSDGHGSGASAMPVGSRIQLDPSINVNTLPLSPGGKVIARALQVYGGWVADTGTAAAVDAREFVSLDANGNAYVDAGPWAGLLTHMDLRNFPVNRLRVLQTNPNDFFREGVAAPTATSTRRPTNTPTRVPTSTPASSLPVSYPTVYDDMNSGAPDWQSSGNWSLLSAVAYGGTGLGWRATGTERSTLRFNRQVDLRNVPNAYLWFQSRLSTTSATSPAQVHVSLDGITWKRLALVPASSGWHVPSINLGAYLGKRIQLRFVWVNAQPGDWWRFDDMTIGTLAQGLEQSDWSEVPLEDVPVDEGMDTELADVAAMEAPRLLPADAPVDSAPALETPISPVSPMETPVSPAPTSPPTDADGLSLLESDAPGVSAVSNWTPMNQPAGASGGLYLINSDPSAVLALRFDGTRVGVAFVQGPSFGQFTIEIDGLVQQVVNGNAADYQFGQAMVEGLSAGEHTLRIIPQAGVVAIDAFLVPGSAMPLTDPAVLPTEAIDARVAGMLDPVSPNALPTADSRFPTLDAPLAPDMLTRQAPVQPGETEPVSTLPPPAAPGDNPPAQAPDVPLSTDAPAVQPPTLPPADAPIPLN